MFVNQYLIDGLNQGISDIFLACIQITPLTESACWATCMQVSSIILKGNWMVRMCYITTLGFCIE